MRGFLESGLYAAHGAAQAMRKHLEFRQQMQMYQDQQRKFSEQLALERFRAESMKLAQDAENNLRAKQLAQAEANLKFEKDKWEEERKLRERETSASISKQTAEAKKTETETSLLPREVAVKEALASAANTRALAQKQQAGAAELRAKNWPSTHKGVGQEWAKAYEKGYENYLEENQKFWKSTLEDPEQRELADKHATDYANKATSQMFNALTNASITPDNPSGTAITGSDIKASIDLSQVVGAVGSKRTAIIWKKLETDPEYQKSFVERGRLGELNPDEEAALQQYDQAEYAAYMANNEKKKKKNVALVEPEKKKPSAIRNALHSVLPGFVDAASE